MFLFGICLFFKRIESVYFLIIFCLNVEINKLKMIYLGYEIMDFLFFCILEYLSYFKIINCVFVFLLNIFEEGKKYLYFKLDFLLNFRIWVI